MWFTKVSTTAPVSYCQLIQQLMSLLFRSFISGEIAFLPVQFLAKFMEQYRCVVVRRKRRRNSIIKIHAALATTNYSLRVWKDKYIGEMRDPCFMYSFCENICWIHLWIFWLNWIHHSYHVKRESLVKWLKRYNIITEQSKGIVKISLYLIGSWF